VICSYENSFLSFTGIRWCVGGGLAVVSREGPLLLPSWCVAGPDAMDFCLL